MKSRRIEHPRELADPDRPAALRMVTPLTLQTVERELRTAEAEISWRNRTMPALLISGWTAGVSVGLWLAGAHPLTYVALGICAIAALIAGVQEPTPKNDAPTAVVVKPNVERGT